MSKSKDGRPTEGYHQEYIASLRYRNDLPPPEMPPKLLDIPHEGLERFLAPGFAGNMARREEPNIDVDAEGGMPIDLVGIPGLHLGDESGMFFTSSTHLHFLDSFLFLDLLLTLDVTSTAIMAPENPPPVDPADMPLLMSLEQMRNPAPKNSNVSFLRRTQYISSGTSRPAEGGTKNPAMRPTEAKRAKPEQPPKPSRDDPTYIKKHIQKGFDIAYPENKHTGEDTATNIKGLAPTKAELDAWATPVHPDNPKLKPVGFYPLVPDLQGFPDPGGFIQFKFDKAPVSRVSGKRDDRMDVGILVPAAPEERVCKDHSAKVALHKANPKLYPDPGPVPWDYDLFLPEKKDDSKKIKKSLSTVGPNRDDEENYTHESADGAKYHRYDRVRTYATGMQTLSAEQKYKDIALTLFDPADGNSNSEDEPHRLTQKGAYYYPLLGKMRLKPERARTIAQAGLAPTAAGPREDRVDQIQVVVRDPDEEEALKRASHRAQVDSKFAATMPSAPSVQEEDGVDESQDKGVSEGGDDAIMAEEEAVEGGEEV